MLGIKRSKRPKLRRVAFGVIVLGLCSAAALSAAEGRSSAAAPGAPNVLVVMTDDQALTDMRVMPEVQRLIGDQGMSFSNSFASDPLCCPSRSTFLTGQYAHNHGVLGGGDYAFLDNSETLAVWLQGAGYHTGLIGKYVNGYGRPNVGGPTVVPPGWSEWYAASPGTTPGLNRDQSVYDYDLNENGTLVSYGSAPEDFKGDVLTGKAVDFIGRNAPSADPFFVWVAYTAPHNTYPVTGTSAPCDDAPAPAPRHLNAFANEPVPRPPNYDEADVSDKPVDVSSRPLLDPGAIAEMDRQTRCRLASLLHVDEGVAQMVEALDQAGELDDTLIIFTSDNGQLLGEHRITGSKIYPYEESIRVPLVMRGPGIPAGQTRDGLVANIDLPPTILEAAGVTAGLSQDGTSLLADSVPQRDLVIESYIDDDSHTPYSGIRSWRYIYLEYTTGEKELYDLQWDPYELDNVVGHPVYAPTVDWMAARLAQLRDCAGAGCRTWTGAPPDPPDSARPQPADTTPPKTRIDKHPKKKISTSKRTRRVRFKFSADEVATFKCKLPHRDWRKCRSPERFRVGVGWPKFRVRATDAAGNTDPTPAVWRGRVQRRAGG